MTQSSLFGFVNPMCLMGCGETARNGQYTKSVKNQRIIVTLFRCPKCSGTIRNETID